MQAHGMFSRALVDEHHILKRRAYERRGILDVAVAQRQVCQYGRGDR